MERKHSATVAPKAKTTMAQKLGDAGINRASLPKRRGFEFRQDQLISIDDETALLYFENNMRYLRNADLMTALSETESVRIVAETDVLHRATLVRARRTKSKEIAELMMLYQLEFAQWKADKANLHLVELAEAQKNRDDRSRGKRDGGEQDAAHEAAESETAETV